RRGAAGRSSDDAPRDPSPRGSAEAGRPRPHPRRRRRARGGAGGSAGAAEMKVTVKYAAQARVATGLSHEVVELDEPTTIHDLIIRLARQHGSAFRRFA